MTPTIAPSATPLSTPTGTPTIAPTAEPTSTAAPTATPEPCWLTDQDLGDPNDGFIVYDGDGAPVPCPVETAEDTNLQEESPPIDTPTDEPTPTVAAASSVARTRLPVAAVGAAPTPAPQPTYTPYPTYTPQPTYTPAATATATSARAPTLTAMPRVSPTATATSVATRTPVPLGAAAPPEVRDVLNVPWQAIVASLGGAVLLLVLMWAAVLFRKRRTVRKPRPPREDVYA